MLISNPGLEAYIFPFNGLEDELNQRFLLGEGHRAAQTICCRWG